MIELLEEAERIYKEVTGKELFKKASKSSKKGKKGDE